MSLNVLIIPEDFRKDQYVLKPMVSAMFEQIGRPANVQVCRDPLLGGVSQALRWERIEEILFRYRGMVKIFLLIVDRDGESGRQAALAAIEEKARSYLGSPDHHLLGESAWQEVEVWVLAGMKDLPTAWSWRAVRAELDPKEQYFDRYVKIRSLGSAPYDGRDLLAREAARNYPRLRQLCPEDIGRLEERLRTALDGS